MPPKPLRMPRWVSSLFCTLPVKEDLSFPHLFFLLLASTLESAEAALEGDVKCHNETIKQAGNTDVDTVPSSHPQRTCSGQSWLGNWEAQALNKCRVFIVKLFRSLNWWTETARAAESDGGRTFYNLEVTGKSIWLNKHTGLVWKGRRRGHKVTLWYTGPSSSLTPWRLCLPEH